MGSDGAGSRTNPNAVLSITSSSEMNSNSETGTTMLPFSLHQSFGPRSDSLIVPIPQDVESRPTSSMLERLETEEVEFHHDGASCILLFLESH